MLEPSGWGEVEPSGWGEALAAPRAARKRRDKVGWGEARAAVLRTARMDKTKYIVKRVCDAKMQCVV